MANYLTSHESDILRGASELRERGLYCDATLTTEDEKCFKIHRVILASVSTYFRALFKSNLGGGVGGDRRDFPIPGVAGDMFALLVGFAYSSDGVTHVTEENVTRLLPAADQFCVTQVVTECTRFLLERMDEENCIGFRDFARIYFLFELEREADKCLRTNFVRVSHVSEEFLEMPLEEVVALLSCDRLHVRGEEQVWEAGLRWIEHAADIRKGHAHHILRCVRLGLLDTAYFMETVKQHPYVAAHEDCRPIVIETLRFLWDLESTNAAKSDTPLETPLLATPRIPHSILFTIGGWQGGAPTSSIETYDTKADRWIQVPDVDTNGGPRAYHKLAVIGFDIYVIGGFNGSDYFRSCRCFNAETRQWRDVAPMNCKRCYVSVASVGDTIYAMGGYDGDHRQNSVERYDHNRNQWTLIEPMDAQRSDASATTLDGKIYIVGGFNGNECLSSCESYDPATDEWTPIAPMGQRRSGVSVISHHGHLYALGGFNGISRLSSGERYDPRTNLWTAIPDMFHPRSNFAVEVMDDLIFAMGGFNGVHTIFHVDCFNDRANDGRGEWLEATDMHAYRSALASCVIAGLPDVDAYVHADRRGLMEERRQRMLEQQRRRAEATAAALVVVANADV